METQDPDATDGARHDAAITRRRLLGGAGALAGSAAVAAATGVATADAASVANTSPPRAGTTVAEFVAQVAQDGSALISYGYFTRLQGVDKSALFSGEPSEATALYTVYADGNLVSRAVIGQVFVLDVSGTLGAYRRGTPGATFSDPSTFKVGTRIASFDVDLQDVLTVIAPNTGIPTLAGGMAQTSSSGFGRKGLRLRLSATGLGTRTEATTPVAVFNIAGNMVAV